MCNHCNWEQHIEDLEELVEDEQYAFAYDTLSGILDWVVSNEHITSNQIKAIENIQGSVYEN